MDFNRLALLPMALQQATGLNAWMQPQSNG